MSGLNNSSSQQYLHYLIVFLRQFK